jgi:GT2 family glycosyltransferase
MTIDSSCRPKVYVIIVTWNRADAVVRCVLSQNLLTYPNVEVVVVDNHSEDDTVERLCSIFPELTVLVNERNLGYTGGNNVGIQWGLSRGADYFFILNNDAIVDPRVLDELVRVAESDRRIAVVGAKNVVMHNSKMLWAAWGDITYGPTLTRVHGRWKRDGRSYRRIRDVDHVVGNGFMWRREALESIGLLDTNFFGYHEDVDWCYRAKRAGWRVVYVGSAIVRHEGSLSSNPHFESRMPAMYFIGRNAVLFTKKHAGALRLAQLTFTSLAGSIWRYVPATWKGYKTGERLFWQGFWDGLWNRNRLGEFRV